MFVDQNTVAGDCIDGEYIVTALENLNFIQECTNVESNQFFCERFDVEGTQAISFNTSELCLNAATKADVADPEAGSAMVKKVLHFVAQYSAISRGSSETSGTLAVARTLRIVCDGTTVKTLSRPEALGIITVELECPDNSDIQVCFDSRVASLDGDFISSQETIRICGALVCVKDSTFDSSTGFLVPPNLDPQCNYGKEALFLIFQNIASLRAKLSEGAQITGCQLIEYDDLDEHVLLNNPTTETSYLLLGYARGVIQNASTLADAYATLRPRISCGGDSLECLEASIQVRAAEEGNATPTTGAIQANIADCGTCATGENLTISYRSALVCNETPSQLISGIQTEFISSRQEYCLFTFAKASNDFESINEQVEDCIDISTIQEAESAARELLSLCDSNSPVGTLTYESEGVVIGTSGVRILAPALSWPPLDDPTNTDPAPINKFWMNVYFQPCHANGSFSSEETFAAEGTIIIECGDTELYRLNVQWILSRATTRSCAAGVSAKRCIECPSDEPIRARFEGRAVLGAFVAPNEFEYYINLFRYT